VNDAQGKYKKAESLTVYSVPTGAARRSGARQKFINPTMIRSFLTQRNISSENSVIFLFNP